MDPDWNNPNADYSKTEVYECMDCGKEINSASKVNSQDEDQYNALTSSNFYDR